MVLDGRDRRQDVHLSGLEGLAPLWLPLRHLVAQWSLSLDLRSTSTPYFGIWIVSDLLDDRDHDYPGLVRSG